MGRFNIDYTGKDIPTPWKDESKLQFILQTNCSLKSMRWNTVTFFQNLDKCGKETLKLNTINGLVSVEEIKSEEEMLLKANLQFMNTIKNLLENFLTDAQNILKWVKNNKSKDQQNKFLKANLISGWNKTLIKWANNFVKWQNGMDIV